MIHVDQSGNNLIVFFNVDDDRVGVCEGVVENVVNDM